MKRIAIITLAAFITLSLTAPAFAKAGTTTSQNMEVDGSVVLATAPAAGFGLGLGVTVGAGAMLPQINKNLQGRFDISYFTWSASEFGADVSYTRIPLLFSGRFIVPTQDSRLKVYVQGGLELSFDKAEFAIPLPSPPFAFGTVKGSSSETRIGLVPGAGIEYKLSPTLGLVADTRWHIITDSYFTVQAGLASHFEAARPSLFTAFASRKKPRSSFGAFFVPFAGTAAQDFSYQPCRLSEHHANCPAANPEAQAQWRLYPPSCPVTSTTSPMK
jgi:hypothetical protein